MCGGGVLLFRGGVLLFRGSFTRCGTLRDALREPLRDTLWNTLRDTLRDTPRDTVWDTLRDTMPAHNARTGCGTGAPARGSKSGVTAARETRRFAKALVPREAVIAFFGTEK